MGLLERLFPLPPKPSDRELAEDPDERYHIRERNLVATFSRRDCIESNISLQRGKYITAEDVDRRRNTLGDYTGPRESRDSIIRSALEYARNLYQKLTGKNSE